MLLLLSDPALALAQSTRALHPADATAAVSNVGHLLLRSTVEELPARPAANISSAVKPVNAIVELVGGEPASADASWIYFRIGCFGPIALGLWGIIVCCGFKATWQDCLMGVLGTACLVVLCVLGWGAAHQIDRTPAEVASWSLVAFAVALAAGLAYGDCLDSDDSSLQRPLLQPSVRANDTANDAAIAAALASNARHRAPAPSASQSQPRPPSHRLPASSAVPPSSQPLSPSPAADTWEWEDSHAGSGNWKQYDAQSAAALTAAAANGINTFQLTIHGNAYDIGLSSMQQRNRSTGFERQLRRGGGAGSASPPQLVGFPGTYGQPPPYWAAQVQQRQVLLRGSGKSPSHDLVPVAKGSSLYVEVSGILEQTCKGLAIISIKLVHNLGQFNMYLAKKDEFVNRLGKGKANERWLWHGTKEDSVKDIISNGFLRDYNTTAVYGRGTYFARDARYSLQKQYAVPNANGEQTLLLSRVLLGCPCKGHQRMTKPDQKPGSVQLHESMVDSLFDPSIFVLSTGSDHQAFPEFVICMRKA